MPQTATSSFITEHIQQSSERRQRIRKLEDGITELSAHIHAATFRLLELIREYDECKGWAQPGLRSCAHWLNWKCGISLGAAREKVRVAHALEELPKITLAFREGRISFSKVRAMTRVATPDNEDYLMMIARHGTAAHVERVVRHYRQVKRSEALKKENQRHDFRELQIFPVEDGSFIVKGRLTPEQGALLKKALESGMDETFWPCTPTMPNLDYRSRRTPRFPCGAVRKWTTNWPWKGFSSGNRTDQCHSCHHSPAGGAGTWHAPLKAVFPVYQIAILKRFPILRLENPFSPSQ